MGVAKVGGLFGPDYDMWMHKVRLRRRPYGIRLSVTGVRTAAPKAQAQAMFVSRGTVGILYYAGTVDRWYR